MISHIFWGIAVFCGLMTLNDINEEAKDMPLGAIITAVAVVIAFYFGGK